MTDPSDVVHSERERTEFGFSDDVVSQRNDKRTDGFPREGCRRKKDAPPSQPALWRGHAAQLFAPEPVWGQYPKGFVAWACEVLRVPPSEVLHLCSGALLPGQGTRVDVRAAARPDVRADARRLPFRDSTFPAVLIDPPYTLEHAEALYQVEYPRPSALLREAARVVRPCGRVAILHFLVPMAKPPLALETVYGVTTGAGYRIRALTVYEKHQDSLFTQGDQP